MVKPSMHETPLLRVSRPVSACSRCRSAKIRCDGKLPSCTACERSNRASECSSANDQFAKGKERSYVAALESRIEKLEKKLAQSKGRKASVAMTGMGSLEANASQSQVLSKRATKRREAADMEELISDFGYMSVNATTRDFYGFTSTMSFSRLVLSASTVHNIPPSRALPLPARYLAMPLINDYLQNIFGILPFFSETSIFASIDAVYQNNGLNASDLDHYTVNMILAIASSLRSWAHGDAEYRSAEGYIAAALRRADEVLIPGSIAGIQAILLLVVYAMLDPAHFDSWYLIGIASRAVVDIGLHHDPAKQAMPNKAQLERRRRVFYCVYTLDRSISMVHARAFSFTDDSMNVALPSLSSKPNVYGSPGNGNGQVWQQPVNAALHLFRLRLIESSWYQALFMSGRTAMDNPSSYIFGVLKQMNDWTESIPKSVPASIKELLKLESLYGKIYCLAPNGRVHTICDIGRALTFEYSIAYMDILQPISRSRDNTAFFNFHNSLKVYFIGGLLLETLWFNEEQIIGGFAPRIHYRPGPNDAPVPPIPNIGRSDNAARAINCINQILDVLQTYASRWEQAAALHSKFRSESAAMLSNLTQRLGGNAELRLVNNGADGPYRERERFGLDLESMLQDEWQRIVTPEQTQNGQSMNISLDAPMASSISNGLFQFPGL